MRYEYYLISLTLTYPMYNGYKKKWLIVYPSRGVNKIETNRSNQSKLIILIRF